MNHIYWGAKIVFSTMHKKENILSSIFKQKLNIDFLVPPAINTDQFGTFTGEIKRESALKEVLRKKALLGLELCQQDVGLASEGSFGPHPWMPFVECNQESLLLLDKKRNIEIFVNHINTKNRAHYAEVSRDEELSCFLTTIGFPQQAVIVKPTHDYSGSSDYIFKGLTNEKKVSQAIKIIYNDLKLKKIWIETDHRAHLSPARRQTILEAGRQLLAKIMSVCPTCNYPGFDMSDVIRGLVCSECGQPSRHPKEEIWTCSNRLCFYSEVKPRWDGMTSLDPSECEECNP